MPTARKKAKKTDERYTSPSILALRDRVWGRSTITDPCWNPRSFSTAHVLYTKADDGLVQPWYGHAWVNPPWSNPMPWVVRMVMHGDGMLLVRNDPGTSWSKLAYATCDAVAFLGRERYYQLEDGELVRCGSPDFSSALFYYGDDVAAFVRECQAAGYIVVIPQRKEHSAMPLLMEGARRHFVSTLVSTPQLTLREIIEDALGIKLPAGELARTVGSITIGEIIRAAPPAETPDRRQLSIAPDDGTIVVAGQVPSEARTEGPADAGTGGDAPGDARGGAPLVLADGHPVQLGQWVRRPGTTTAAMVIQVDGGCCVVRWPNAPVPVKVIALDLESAPPPDASTFTKQHAAAVGSGPDIPDLDPDLHPRVKKRVEQLYEWLHEHGRDEFLASEVMEAFGVSRQTVLRTVAHCPNIETEGKGRTARYKVA